MASGQVVYAISWTIGLGLVGGPASLEASSPRKNVSPYALRRRAIELSPRARSAAGVGPRSRDKGYRCWSRGVIYCASLD